MLRSPNQIRYTLLNGCGYYVIVTVYFIGIVILFSHGIS